jgi:hypothetical protein
MTPNQSLTLHTTTNHPHQQEAEDEEEEESTTALPPSLPLSRAPLRLFKGCMRFAKKSGQKIDLL